jgi:predicted acetyltransferase
MVTADPGVRALLWRYVFDLDLVTKVESWTTPVDDPLRWLLADARQLNRSSVGDWLWTRLLDVPAALSARTYGAEGRVVIEVVDGVRKDVAGRYALDGAPEGAVCARTTQEPDLVLGAADLGAAYLGGVALSTLARAGLVEERSSGALTRADAMFASIPLPYCGTWF